MNIRVASTDEHQLLVCLKNNLWGSKNYKKKWNIGDYIYFIVDNFFAAIAIVESDIWVESPSVWSDEKYKYQIKVNFILFIDEENRVLSAKNFFYDNHQIKNYGHLIRNQTKIDSEIANDLDKRFLNKNSVKSLQYINLLKKEKINEMLKITWIDRIKKIIKKLKNTSTKNSYSDSTEVADNINTILFIELMIKSDYGSELSINSLVKYDYLFRNKRINPTEFEEKLKYVKNDFFEIGGVFKLFSHSIEFLNIPTTSMIKISEIIRVIFSEIDYVINNKYIEGNFNTILNDFQKTLFIEETKSKDLNTNKNQLNLHKLFYVLINLVSREFKEVTNILDTNNGNGVVVSKALHTKKDLINLYIEDDSKKNIRNRIIEYLTNEFHINNLFLSEVSTTNFYDFIIYDGSIDTSIKVQQNFEKLIEFVNDGGIFICIISATGERFLNDLVWQRVRKDIENTFTKVLYYEFINSISTERQLLIVSKKNDDSEKRLIFETDNNKEIDLEKILTCMNKIDVLHGHIESESTKSGNNSYPSKSLFLENNIKKMKKDLPQKQEKMNRHPVLDHLTQEQLAIIQAIISVENVHLGSKKYYEIYCSYVSDFLDVIPINIHSFNHTLDLLYKLGILNKISYRIETENEFSHLINLNEQYRWQLNKRFYEEWNIENFKRRD